MNVKCKFILNFILAMAIGVVMLLPHIAIFADNSAIVTITTERSEADKAGKLVNKINDRVLSETTFGKSPNNTWYIKSTYNSTTKNLDIELNMVAYNGLLEKEKQQVIKIALDETRNANLSTGTRNKIYSFISESDATTSALVRQLSDDVNADFISAYNAYFRPFSGVIGTILGGITLLIFILLAFTTVIDIAYIAIPAFQLALSAMADKKNKTNWLCSLEAKKAVEEAQSADSNENKSSMAIYFKLKTKQFIALALCILYLTSGKIYVLIANIIDYFSGFMPK